MKSIKVIAFGGPEVLTPLEIASPVAGAGEVLVDVEAAGVGLVDVLARRGFYPGQQEPGFIPGVEIAGRVVAAGDGEGQHWVGRRVYVLTGAGGYAEQAVVPVAALVPLPDAVAPSAAVALGANGLTAYFSLQRAGVVAGESVLVRGASGGVGSAVVQAAARIGADVTASTGSSRHAEDLRQAGAHRIVGREADDTARYDVIIDPVAGADIAAHLHTLKPNGRYIVCGAAGGFPPTDFAWPLVTGFANSSSISTLSLLSIAPPTLVAAAGKLFDDAATGVIQPRLGASFVLHEAAEAHRALESGDVFGKIVLRPW